MCFVNLSKIENFESIQIQNVYHSVDFGRETDPEKSVTVDITDMYDIKDFNIEIRESSDMSLIQFEAGKYTLINIELAFH